MDFGILYIQNKAATQAAMWLGMIVFLFAVFIPYIGAYLFIPLYIAVLIKLAYYKFKVDGIGYALLLPLAPFVAASLLCLIFWWAVPTIVNIVDELIVLFKPGELSLYREAIPDSKCYLYFILVLGGGVGSIFCLMALLFGMEQTKAVYYYPESLARIRINVASDFCPLIKDITTDYKNGLISCDTANYQIKKRFKQWATEKYNIAEKDIEYLWRSKKWLMEIK